MKTKNIIIFFLILAGLFGLMWWGKPASTSPASIPEPRTGAGNTLSSSEKFYDFGTISMAKGNVSHLFKITNPTDKEVEIKTINTSCMCTTAYLESASGEKGPFGMPGMGYVPPVNEIIKVGESRNIKVVYDPNAHGPAGIGSIDRFIYLTDAAEKTLELEIKAVVTP